MYHGPGYGASAVPGGGRRRSRRPSEGGMSGSLADEIDLRFFEHGGRLDLARELYGQAPEPWIDLSTGISPWAYPVPRLAAGDFHRLPDAAALHRLIETARKAYKRSAGGCSRGAAWHRCGPEHPALAVPRAQARRGPGAQLFRPRRGLDRRRAFRQRDRLARPGRQRRDPDRGQSEQPRWPLHRSRQARGSASAAEAPRRLADRRRGIRRCR